MRMFRLYGEGIRHTSRGYAMARRLWHRWYQLDCSTEEARKAHYRHEKLRAFEAAKKAGVSAGKALEIAGVPSSTLYRWRARYAKYGMRGLVDESRARKTLPQRTARTAAAVELVLSLREEAPWGKAIMAEVLRRMGVGISASSAGRIIAELLAKGRIARRSAEERGTVGQYRQAFQAGLGAPSARKGGEGQPVRHPPALAQTQRQN